MNDKDNEDKLKFKVSTGLKNIIGKDLISDKYIAVFELVKNSYDAGASEVKISFIHSDDDKLQITISDNGCGMSKTDIVEKWLFVGYSEKKPKNKRSKSYIDDIKRVAAGAKGVGRFSCDRLGEKLTLLTKTSDEKFTNVIKIDWKEFETNDLMEFKDVEIIFSSRKNLTSNFNSGTTLVIDNLREKWERKDILKLKHSLMKLISPDASIGEVPFNINIIVPSEEEEDNKKIKSGNYLERDIVNGPIHNDVIEKLNLKSTTIEVTISTDGKTITTKLTDRGEYIFTINEKNTDYDLLKNIHIIVSYLNKGAKSSFTKQMGVNVRNYGSVFIYKNGFRVYPYGEPDRDLFNINSRKNQGLNRYIGTRDIIGRITIDGDNDGFIETSSRAHGFINTSSVEMLVQLFIDKVVRILEKYLANIINWGTPLKLEPYHIIQPYELNEEILRQYFVNSKKGILSVDFNKELFAKRIEDTGISSSVKKLQYEAEGTRNKEIIDLAREISNKTNKILSQNIALEKENLDKTKELSIKTQENKIIEKQVTLLTGVTNQTVENLLDGMHSIFTQTEAIRGNIKHICEIIDKSDITEKSKVLKILDSIAHSNKKSNKISELAIKGNQTLVLVESDDIKRFINQYLKDGVMLRGLNYKIDENDNKYICRYDPISIGIILDNVASNSIKSGSDELRISFSENNSDVCISFYDNGTGINPNVNPNKLFELGISTKNGKGFGMGLHQIKKLVEKDMKGTVKIDTSYTDGFKLVVCIPK